MRFLYGEVIDPAETRRFLILTMDSFANLNPRAPVPRLYRHALPGQGAVRPQAQAHPRHFCSFAMPPIQRPYSAALCCM